MRKAKTRTPGRLLRHKINSRAYKVAILHIM